MFLPLILIKTAKLNPRISDLSFGHSQEESLECAVLTSMTQPRYIAPSQLQPVVALQNTPTTVPVPTCFGSAPKPALVLTMTIFITLPEIVLPDLVVEFDTRTAMYADMLLGGIAPRFEVQVDPQATGVVLSALA